MKTFPFKNDYNPSKNLIKTQGFHKFWTKGSFYTYSLFLELLERGGGQAFSTDQVYEFMTNPNGQDIHHFILQYLEEGTIDLVCLSTDLVMEHCDVTRAAAGATGGKYSH